MTLNELIALARQAGLMVTLSSFDSVEKFAALVAAAERDRLHDKFMEIHKSQQHSNNYWHFAARKIKEEA